MPADRRVVYAARFLRASANGLIGVVAGIYLARFGFSRVDDAGRTRAFAWYSFQDRRIAGRAPVV